MEEDGEEMGIGREGEEMWRGRELEEMGILREGEEMEIGREGELRGNEEIGNQVKEVKEELIYSFNIYLTQRQTFRRAERQTIPLIE